MCSCICTKSWVKNGREMKQMLFMKTLGSDADSIIIWHLHHDSVKYYYLLTFGRRRHMEVIQFVKYQTTSS